MSSKIGFRNCLTIWNCLLLFRRYYCLHVGKLKSVKNLLDSFEAVFKYAVIIG